MIFYPVHDFKKSEIPTKKKIVTLLKRRNESLFLENLIM